MNTVKSKFYQIITSKESLLFLILFIAGLSILGWIFGKVILASVSSEFIPMAPSSALIFIILSSSLLLKSKFRESPNIQSFNTALVALVILYCLNIFLGYLFNYSWDTENIFIKNQYIFGNVPIGHMSPITALLLIFICTGLLTNRQKISNYIKYIGGSFSLMACVLSSVLLIGYLYKAPLLYGSKIIPVALPTVICCLLFSITLLRIFEVKFWTYNFIKDNKISNQLLKWFLSISIFIVIFQGYLIANYSIIVNNLTLFVALTLFIVIPISIILVVRVSSLIGIRLLTAEQKLEESEKEFHSLAESMPQVVWTTRADGWNTYFNQQWVDYTGLTLEESYGHGWNPPFHPEDRQLAWDAWQNAVKNNAEYSIECRLKCYDGTYRWWLVRGVPQTNAKGEIVKWFGTCTDIEKIKNAEFELKERYNEIETINKDLSETNAKLVLAKEKAEESDRLKSTFLTNMSHEIRTPMNGILGFAELLKEPNLSADELQDYIQTIQISGARMLNTINSIVDMSKIESGLIHIDLGETEINDKMEFIYKFFKPEADMKGLHLKLNTSLTDKEAIIKTDKEKVYGILTNLLRNAIKFTFDGSIEFGYVLKPGNEPVSTEQSRSGSTEQSRSAELEFFVKDTGIGIPKKQQQLVFERFRQGSEAHNRGYEGSGLGLSICKSYLEMLGGRIWVESEEGLGSTFFFTIPYNPVSDETKEIGKVVLAENIEVQIKKLNILIVEDDEISYSLLTRVVQKISKEVFHAVTGIEAVEACRNNPDFDLVLMDIRMPQMNGLEATQKIRQFNKDVIIIAQTAFAFTGDNEKAIEAGCNDYITKPINRNLLFELIKKHVKN